MPSDYTDFVVLICDSGERVYHRSHFRKKGNILLGKTDWLWKDIPGAGGEKYRYAQMLDRAYRIRWTPWIWDDFKLINVSGVLKEIFRKKKIGLLMYQEPTTPSDMPIEPLHISRIAQPSGRLDDNDNHEPGVVDKMSPFVLKMIVDASSKYRKAYKSYAFGLKQKLMSRWVLFLILGVVGIVMLLYFTGYIRV